MNPRRAAFAPALHVGRPRCAPRVSRRGASAVCARAGPPRGRLSRRDLLRVGALAAGGVVAGGGEAWAQAAPPMTRSMGARTVAESALRQSVLFEPASGSLLPVSALRGVLSRRKERCFVLGEVHDEMESHAAQLAALELLHAQADRPLVVGFEMFYRQHNPALDAYHRGEIGIDALLRRTDWKHNWGYPPELYTPILQFCRQNKIRMIGLNCPEQVTRFISQVGLQDIAETYPQLRDMLPRDIDVSNADHRKHFYVAMGFGPNPAVAATEAHSATIKSRERLERWYEAQCTWDEVMAESLAVALDSHKNARVVALVGSGHMETRTAIPDRIEKRSGERPFSIVTRPVGWQKVGGVSFPDIDAHERGSDLVWYTYRKLDIV